MTRPILLMVGLLLAVTAATAVGVAADRNGVPVAAAQTPDPDASPEPGATPEPGGTPDPSETPVPTPAPPPPDPGPVSGGSLGVGFTEANPNLLWPASAKALPFEFARWRDEVGAIRPSHYRLQLDWSLLQDEPGGPLVLDRFNGGCVRDRLPCEPYLGLREQLQALAARQAEGGWETVVAISGTPEWAAEPPGGCERDDAAPRRRAPRADALGLYSDFVARLLAAAQEAGAELRWFNAWNEPNHPYFLSPQRAVCDVASPTVSVERYVALHAALGEVLDATPGEQGRVLGDLAGTRGPGVHLTSVEEFVAALPQDVVCGTPVWAQHAYLAPRDDARVARVALAERGCETLHQIWVTETGARNTAADPTPLRRCQNMHRRLVTWYSQPQVTVAFQYTVREDDKFPYGLIETGLERAYPALGLWQAWGGAARPSAESPTPALGEACVEPAVSGG